MATVQAIVTEIFETGGYPYDAAKRNKIGIVIGRASKKLEDAGLIEEPDLYNGRNGFRVISDEGRKAMSKVDIIAAKVRSQFSREMFHPSLPTAAWNAFRSGDYDTAIFETFKAVESAVRKKSVGKNGITDTDHGVTLMRKAFDPNSGPLTDTSAPSGDVIVAVRFFWCLRRIAQPKSSWRPNHHRPVDRGRGDDDCGNAPTHRGCCLTVCLAR